MLLGGARDWARAVAERLRALVPDLVHGQGLVFAGSTVVGWHGGPRVVTAHGNIVEDLRALYSPTGWALRAPLVRHAGARAVRDADVVVNVTRDWRVNCPVAPRAVRHIPNPVDQPFFDVTPAPGPATVGYFGGSKQIKGLDLLLAAWPRVLRDVPQATLDLFGVSSGDGLSLPPRCRPLPALAGSRAMAAAMAKASVVVIPSRFEVSPLVAAQAMTVGVPLVTTNVGGLRAMCEGVAQLCRREPDELAAGVVSALRDRSAWDARIAEGRARSDAFRLDRVVASHIVLYEELAEWTRRSARATALRRPSAS
jgi:glycosyltransferase involved in cell wall biosynthesis